ncbi:MAG: hypothetical protein JRJ09_08060 [Deltaproteobacteria bacterium]|nr:hypothetical protein [Deltaproteobacteria bacterium]MBW2048467.1 hypothetical protein [Deltaproteobacteria bacterium]MBW2111054.1 hypothetical protein [Deltaproteobacteria bacterium]MBW2353015.1 hypothetical protein [Deltaproteobacteria bacterium]
MKSDGGKNLTYRSAVLFPHSYLPKSVEERVFSHFPSLIVCQPWYMDRPVVMDGGDDHRVTIVRPPQDLKPPTDFMRLLSEYRLWMSQNLGSPPLYPDEDKDSTWEIRKALRQGGKETPEPFDEQALRWHLTLHLERDLEESRISADEMLLMMKDSPSPLEDALGEAGPDNGFLHDLPVSHGPSPMEERHLIHVLKAWFGLFGGEIPDNPALLTFGPEVVEWAAEFMGAEPPEPSADGGAKRFRRIDLPLISAGSPVEKDSVRHGLSGRTLFLV